MCLLAWARSGLAVADVDMPRSVRSKQAACTAFSCSWQIRISIDKSHLSRLLNCDSVQFTNEPSVLGWIYKGLWMPDCVIHSLISVYLSLTGPTLCPLCELYVCVEWRIKHSQTCQSRKWARVHIQSTRQFRWSLTVVHKCLAVLKSFPKELHSDKKGEQYMHENWFSLTVCNL